MAEYALEGPKWDSQPITWDFGVGSPFSSPVGSQYRAAIASALQAWSGAANVTFQQVGDGAPADIEIGFGSLQNSLHPGEIGLTSYRTSGSTFFGPVTVQLEDPAQLPLQSSGQTYAYQNSSTTLQQVALHELGHALGLNHSSDPQAVMYPVAQTSNTGLSIADIAGAQALYGAPAGSDINLTDTTLGISAGLIGTTYNGPVTGLQQQYLQGGSDSVNITGGVPGLFLRGGSGNDALAVGSGRNVLDGGKGSNFLSGGTGAGSQDTFFVDGRGTGAVWNTVANFHPGDTVTVWGYIPGVTQISWVEGQGAAGYTGATMHADIYGNGSSVASLTFAGLTFPQVAPTFAGSGTVGGINYLQFAA